MLLVIVSFECSLGSSDVDSLCQNNARQRSLLVDNESGRKYVEYPTSSPTCCNLITRNVGLHTGASHCFATAILRFKYCPNSFGKIFLKL